MSDGDEEVPMGVTETLPTKQKKGKNIKRRFSDEQIKSLEVIFKSESKLEQRKKVELARDLGLQPRQVAIWFQNKRARWKSKQLEKDYGVLKTQYDNLALQFEDAEKDKQGLVLQLQKLKELIEKQQSAVDSGIARGPNIEQTTGNESKMKQDLSTIKLEENSIKADYFEECNLMKMVETADSSLTSSEDWGNFESDPIPFDQTSTSYQWWDFWS